MFNCFSDLIFVSCTTLTCIIHTRATKRARTHAHTHKIHLQSSRLRNFNIITGSVTAQGIDLFLWPRFVLTFVTPSNLYFPLSPHKMSVCMSN